MRVYKGPSELNGKPIQVTLTNLDKPSRNPKTGDMVHAYIVPVRVNPATAVKTGYDAAVCGDCALRPSVGQYPSVCYVTTVHGPNATYKKHRSAPVEIPSEITKPLRLGAYGDPAAVPVAVWRYLTKLAGKWTGYTHQWRQAPQLQRYCMASVDSAKQARAAQRKGWRTFRPKHASDPLLPGEIACPASTEAGKRTTCSACGLCNGKQGADDRRANIAINYH